MCSATPLIKMTNYSPLFSLTCGSCPHHRAPRTKPRSKCRLSEMAKLLDFSFLPPTTTTQQIMQIVNHNEGRGDDARKLEREGKRKSKTSCDGAPIQFTDLLSSLHPFSLSKLNLPRRRSIYTNLIQVAVHCPKCKSSIYLAHFPVPKESVSGRGNYF